MSPTSLESRMARLEQRVDDLSVEVKTLQPLVVAVAELKIGLTHLDKTLDHVSKTQDALVEQLERRDETRRQGEGQKRWQAYAMIVSMTCVVLAVLAQIIITLANGGP